MVKKVIEEIKKRKEEKRKEIPITFKNERGKELMGIFHLPQKDYNPPATSSHSSLRSEWTPKPPVVIICHGFQGTKSQKSSIKLARELSQGGILAFRFDFEGCGDSEGDPKEITIKNEISDLRAAFQTVLREWDVDSQRVAFVGVSLGAVVASLAAQEINVKTLVFWAPAFNQKELLKKWYSQKEVKTLRKKGVLYKKEKEIGRDYYLENKNKNYSPLLSRLSIPILIIHGTKDEDVPINYSRKLVEKYRNIVLKPLPGADHKFENIFHQKKAINLTVKWLKKYL